MKLGQELKKVEMQYRKIEKKPRIIKLYAFCPYKDFDNFYRERPIFDCNKLDYLVNKKRFSYGIGNYTLEDLEKAGVAPSMMKRVAMLKVGKFRRFHYTIRSKPIYI